MPSMVSAFARIVRYRVDQLGAMKEGAVSPVLDALIAKKEPRPAPTAPCRGRWTCTIRARKDDFVLILKELVLPTGVRRPYSVWMAGQYPRALDGCASCCRSTCA